jgi:hypothetical protein
VDNLSIKKIRWWLGYALIRLGWRVYLTNNEFVDNFYAGVGIEENGISYKIEFVGKERGE